MDGNMLIVRAPTKRLSMRSSSWWSRFIGDPTVVPRRKYYSVGLYTVSRRFPSPPSPRSQMRDTPDAKMRRNTPSRADTCTSPTPTTSLYPQTSSPATSSRQSLLVPSGPHTNIIFFFFFFFFSFTSLADVRPLMWGYKALREIARRMPHFRGEPPMLHPAFPPGGPASVVAHAEGPIAFDTPRIVYSEEDERALEEFARANGAWLLPF